MDIIEFLKRVKGIEAFSYEEKGGSYLVGKISSLYEDICGYFAEDETFKQPTLLFASSDNHENTSVFVEFNGQDYILLDIISSDQYFERFQSFFQLEWRNLSRVYRTNFYDEDYTSDNEKRTIDNSFGIFKEYFLLYSATHEIGHYLIKKGFLDSCGISPNLDCHHAAASQAIRCICDPDPQSVFYTSFLSSKSFQEEITSDSFALFVLFHFYIFHEGENGYMMPGINQMMGLLLLCKKQYDLVDETFGMKETLNDAEHEKLEELVMLCEGLELRQIVSYCIYEELIGHYCRAFLRLHEEDLESEVAISLMTAAEEVFSDTYFYEYKLLSYYLRLDELHILRAFLNVHEEVFNSSRIEELSRILLLTPFYHTSFTMQDLKSNFNPLSVLLENTMERGRFLNLMTEEYEKSTHPIFHLHMRNIIGHKFYFKPS